MTISIVHIVETNLAVYTIKVVEATKEGYQIDVNNYPVAGVFGLFEAYMIKEDEDEEPDEGTPDAALLQHLVVAATVPKIDMRLKANRK